MRYIALFGHGPNWKKGSSHHADFDAFTGAGTTLSVPELASLRGRS